MGKNCDCTTDSVMDFPYIEVQTLYDRDKNLKKQDVEALMDWANKQPHLPKINELQTILFLHSCYYKNEAAKNTIETFFTLRTHCPDMFKTRNALVFQQTDVCLITTLPKKTPQGYTVILVKFSDAGPEKFNFPKFVKYFDLVFMLHLFQKGPSDGYYILFDIKTVTFGHFTRALPYVKTFLHYLQEALPIRLKGIHFYNIVPFMDKILTVIRPLMKQGIEEMLVVHTSVENLTKFIPFECLPEDFGGSETPGTVLLEQIKKELEDDKYNDFFQWIESLDVDENKRVEKIENWDLYGLQGTFKKLEID